jgi:hypothetical protein
MRPIEIIVWACVGVFVLTAILTMLHLISGKVFRNPAHGNTLFKVLVVEIVGIAIVAFSSYLSDPGSKAIVNSSDPRPPGHNPPIEPDNTTPPATPVNPKPTNKGPINEQKKPLDKCKSENPPVECIFKH